MREKTTNQEVAEEAEKVTIQALKNTYESKLIEKDGEIRRLQGIVNAIQRIVGITQNERVSMPLAAGTTGGNLEMWLGKLGKGGASAILKFLAENYSNSFTRQQLALAVGLSYESVRIYTSKLKRNLLVKEEADKWLINPNL